MTLPPFIKSYSEDVVGERKKMLVRETAVQFNETIKEEDEHPKVKPKKQEKKAKSKAKSMDVDLEAVCSSLNDADCIKATQEEYKVDSLFYRICFLTFAMGVNFYVTRGSWQRGISWVIVSANVILNMYYIGYLLQSAFTGPFDRDTIVTTLGITAATLQSTLSTLFLAHWQKSKQFCGALKQLYSANKGVGIHASRKQLRAIVMWFYFVIFLIVAFHATLAFASVLGWDMPILKGALVVVGDHRYIFLIFQLSHMYIMICWAVALFIFVLLIRATHFEFDHFNQMVAEMGSTSGSDTDELLCWDMIRMIKIHNKLTDCVKRLDVMFNIYTFVMIATIIPTSIFALLMLGRQLDSFYWMLCSGPIILYCIFSFFALTDAPSQLHNAIYNTKSALCANTHIWFPYRPNVYHSAMAFMCHLDQANLGISIWGFAVVSKPLVLTTLSVMVTCLALFLQVGECKFVADGKTLL